MVKFVRKPFPHQQKILKKIKNQKRIALFWEMRLGKTLVILRWLKYIKPESVLIVCPKSVIQTWVSEGKKEYINIIPLDSGSIDDKVNNILKHSFGFYCVNYESLVDRKRERAYPSEIFNFQWDCIILDESTKIKNPKAKITKVLLQESKHTEYRAILTGMPAPEGCENYFTQMRFVYGSFMSKTNFWYWRNHFFKPSVFKWIPKKGSITCIYKEVKRLSYALTRKKIGIKGKNMHEVRYLKLPFNSREAYKNVLRDWCFDGKSTKYAVTRCGWLHKICGGIFTGGEHTVKIFEIIYLLKSELKNENVIIWCKYNKEIRILIEHIRKYTEFSVEFINGKVCSNLRKEYLLKFNKKKLRILIVNVKCISYGVDLSCCSTFIYYSNPWSCEEKNQSLDRGINLKKKEPNLIIELVCEDTIDEYILSLLRKKTISHKLFQSELLNMVKSNG